MLQDEPGPEVERQRQQFEPRGVDEAEHDQPDPAVVRNPGDLSESLIEPGPAPKGHES